MNKILVLMLGLVLITGCTTTSKIFGRSSEKVVVKESAVQTVNNQLAMNSQDKLSEIGTYSYGISISTNNSIDHTLNSRISSLANEPTIVQQNSMRQIVKELEATNITLLSQKDIEISAIQNKEVILQQEKASAIHQVEELSSQIALQSDSNAAELAKYHSAWGLEAVILGILQFIHNCFWTLLIGGTITTVVFILLRVLASTNPVFAAALKIFDGIGYSVIKIIEYIVPNAVSAVVKDIQAIETETIPSVAAKPLPNAPVSGSL